VRKAVAQVIDGLATDPRPPGFLPLTGHRPCLRVDRSLAAQWLLAMALQ